MKRVVAVFGLLGVALGQDKGLRSSLGARWGYHRELFAHFYEKFRTETGLPLIEASVLFKHTQFFETLGSFLPSNRRIDRIIQADDFLADVHVANFPQVTGYRLVEIGRVEAFGDLIDLEETSRNLPDGRYVLTCRQFSSLIPLEKIRKAFSIYIDHVPNSRRWVQIATADRDAVHPFSQHFACWLFEDHVTLQQYNAQRDSEFQAVLRHHEQSVLYQQSLWMSQRLEERSMRATLSQSDEAAKSISLKAAEVQYLRSEFFKAFYAMTKDIYAEIRNAVDIVTAVLQKIFVLSGKDSNWCFLKEENVHILNWNYMSPYDIRRVVDLISAQRRDKLILTAEPRIRFADWPGHVPDQYVAMPSLMETAGPGRFLSHILRPFVWREGVLSKDVVIDSLAHIKEGDVTACLHPFGLTTDASSILTLIDATLGRRARDIVNFLTPGRIGSSLLLPFWEQVGFMQREPISHLLTMADVVKSMVDEVPFPKLLTATNLADSLWRDECINETLSLRDLRIKEGIVAASVWPALPSNTWDECYLMEGQCFGEKVDMQWLRTVYEGTVGWVPSPRELEPAFRSMLTFWTTRMRQIQTLLSQVNAR